MTDTTLGIKLQLDGAQQVQAGAAAASQALSDIERQTIKLQAAQAQLAQATARAQQAQDALNKSRLGGDSAAIEAASLRLATAQAAQAKASAATRDAMATLEKQTASLGKTAGLTGNQTAQMSAQLQDLFVQIQAGGSPMTALIQQGSQLSAVFGGFGPALRAVGSLFSPVVVGIGSAAAALGTLGYAYAAADAERMAFVRGLTLSGNALGETVGGMQAAAAAVGKLVGGQAAASAAMAQYASAGVAAGASMEKIAEAALRMERVGGAAVEDTIKAFTELAKSPLAATLKLNEGTNFLTLSLYKQIKALEEQGNKTEAARVAQEAFANESISRAGQIEAQLGVIQRGWLDVTDAITKAKNALLSIGRGSTQQDEMRAALEEAEKRVAAIEFRLTGKGTPVVGKFSDAFKSRNDLLFEQGEQRAAADGLRDALRELDVAERKAASAAAGRAAATAVGIKADQDASKAAESLKKERDRLIQQGREILRTQALQNAGLDPQFIEQWKALNAVLGDNPALLEQVRIAQSQLTLGSKAARDASKREEDALADLDKALEENAKARMAAYLASDKANDEADKRVASLQKETDALRDQFAELQGGKAAREEMASARLRERIALAQAEASAAANDNQPAIRIARLNEEVELLREQLSIRQNIVRVTADKEAAKEAEKAAEAAQRDWERTADSIRSSLTDAFRRAFESGEDFGTAFAKSIANEIKARFSAAIAGSLSDFALALGALAVESMSSGDQSGGASSAWIGKAKDASSIYNWGERAYNWYTGAGSVSATYGTSATIGGTVAQSSATKAALFGNAGYTGAAEGAAAGGSAAAGGGAAGGASAMSTLGPYAIAAIAYAIGADQMADWSLHMGGYSRADRTGVRNIAAELGTTNSQLDDATIAGMREQGVPIDSMQSLSDGIAQRLLKYSGQFASSVGARSPIEAVQTVFESDRANPSWGEVKFLGAAGREVGSTGMRTDLNWNPQVASPQLVTASVGAFSTAMQESDAADWVKKALANIPKELERIAPDIAQKFEDPLEQANAMAAAAAGMLDGISNAYKALDTLDEQLGVLGGAFGQLSGMSSDARNALVSLFGGMEKFQAQIASYVDNFYSEGEKTALVTKQIGDTLGTVGLKLPDTRDGFKALVNAQDLSTESGRKAFGVLMGVADAFASITEPARSASDILNERKGLEEELLTLQGDTVALRKLERDAIDESNRALYDQIQALKAAQALTSSRSAAIERLGTPQQASAYRVATAAQSMAGAGVDLGTIQQILQAPKRELLGLALAYEKTAGASSAAKTAVFDAAVAIADMAEEAEQAALDLDEFMNKFASLDFNIIDDAMINKVAELSGGFGNLTDNLSTYFDEFMTEGERMANTAQSLSLTLKAVGVEVPNTVDGLRELGRDGFKALVQAAVGSGNESAVSALLKVSGAFANLVPTLDQTISSIQTALAKVNSEYDKLINNIKDKWNIELKALSQQEDAATAAYNLGMIPINAARIANDKARDLGYEGAFNRLMSGADLGANANLTYGSPTGQTLGAEIAQALGTLRATYPGLKPEELLTEAVKIVEGIGQTRAENLQKQIDKIDRTKAIADEVYAQAMTLFDDKLGEIGKTIDRFTSLVSSLENTLAAMRPIGAEAADRQLAQQQIRDALTEFQRSGKLPEAKEISGALSIVSRPSDQLFASQADYLRDFNRTRNDVQALLTASSGKLSTAQADKTAVEELRKTIETAFKGTPQQRLDALGEGFEDGKYALNQLRLAFGYADEVTGDLADSLGGADTAAGGLKGSLTGVDGSAAALNATLGNVDTTAGSLNTNLGAVDTAAGTLNTTLTTLNGTLGGVSTSGLTSADTAASTLNTTLTTLNSNLSGVSTAGLTSANTAATDLAGGLNGLTGDNGAIGSLKSSLNKLSGPEGAVDGLKTSLGKISGPDGAVDGLKTSFGKLSGPDGVIEGLKTSFDKLSGADGAVDGLKSSFGKLSGTDGAVEGLKTSFGKLSGTDGAVDKLKTSFGSLSDPTGAVTALSSSFSSLSSPTGAVTALSSSFSSLSGPTGAVTALANAFSGVGTEAGALRTSLINQQTQVNTSITSQLNAVTTLITSVELAHKALSNIETAKEKTVKETFDEALREVNEERKRINALYEKEVGLLESQRKAFNDATQALIDSATANKGLKGAIEALELALKPLGSLGTAGIKATGFETLANDIGLAVKNALQGLNLGGGTSTVDNVGGQRPSIVNATGTKWTGFDSYAGPLPAGPNGLFVTPDGYLVNGQGIIQGRANTTPTGFEGGSANVALDVNGASGTGGTPTVQTGSYGPNGVWYPNGYNWAENDHTLTGTPGAGTDPSGFGETLRMLLQDEQYAQFRSRAIASATANTLPKAADVMKVSLSYLNELVSQGKFDAFAAGGMHTGGLRLVGEEGPELEVTGPARYYSADQTMAMLRDPNRANEALVAEVKQLRQQVADLQAAMVTTATNTGKTARQLDRWDGEGMPDVRA